MRIVILGAGPTGLGAGWRCHESGHEDYIVFEEKPFVGGLSASFRDQAGFTWDIGGHVLFSHYPYFDAVVERALGGSYNQHQRESWVRILSTWVPYPFQNNIRHLPKKQLQECLEGLKSLSGSPAAAGDFFEWMNAVFGSGIVKYFMEPYNRKVWGTPLEMMDKKWIGERVSVVDLTRIENNIANEKDDVNWGPNNLFKFPRYGGTGAIFERIAHNIPEISLECSVREIDLKQKKIKLHNGNLASYDYLITTIPLDQFLLKCVQVPDQVRNAAQDLIHNSGLIVGLGIEASRSDSRCWMYFPEANCPFYRVTNFHNYSSSHVPCARTDRYSAFMCETTYSPTKPVDKNKIICSTIDGLEATGMITGTERERIISRYLIDIPYSYPVPTLGRDNALRAILPYLENRGVYSRGRFGAWKYEVGNMDHSFMQGVEAVERILTGKPERTVHGQV